MDHPHLRLVRGIESAPNASSDFTLNATKIAATGIALAELRSSLAGQSDSWPAAGRIAAVGASLARALPPTMQAEALRAWLGDHLQAPVTLAPSYESAADLRECVRAVADEVADEVRLARAARYLDRSPTRRDSMVSGLDGLVGESRTSVPRVPSGAKWFLLGAAAAIAVAAAIR